MGFMKCRFRYLERLVSLLCSDKKGPKQSFHVRVSAQGSGNLIKEVGTFNLKVTAKRLR